MTTRFESTLQLTSLTPQSIAKLAPSFAKLPSTEHADGTYRLRRYSVVKLEGTRLKATDKNDFVQSGDINHFQGDVVRQFEPIDTDIINSSEFFDMCSVFATASRLPMNHEIEIHQMRITTKFEETQVAPEGIHQDGFANIAIVGIDRSNIIGGDLMLYKDNNEAPFFRKVLENGEVAMLDDNKLWHNAEPIRSIVREQEGHMDVFVLTALGAKH